MNDLMDQLNMSLGCLTVVVVSVIFVIVLAVNIANPSIAPASEETVNTGGLDSGVVPPNFATLITEAANQYKLEPAIVAAIYLTEHHTETFGKDIPSLDYVQPKCEQSYAGALGPMQLMPGIVQNFNNNEAAKVGISDPNVCRYRDAFFAGARTIWYKATVEQADAKAACGISGGSKEIVWTDLCTYAIGRAYCGACTSSGCGRNGYDYCAHTQLAFNLTKGSLAYLAPILIEDYNVFKTGSKKCSYVNI